MFRFRLWAFAPFIHRSLFRDFLHQDILGRYAGSLGGLAWSVLNPLATILVYLFIFTTIMKISLVHSEVGTDQFVIYLLSGLFPWMAFAEGVGRAPSLLREKATLITRVSFPVEVLPLVATSSAFVLNGIGFGVFLLYLVSQGYLHFYWLGLPLLVLFQFMLASGVVALFAVFGVFFRDLQQFIGVLIFVWFFMTPIIYPLSMAPESFQAGMLLNPMYLFVDLYRQLLLQHEFSLLMFAYAAFLSVVVFLIGGWFFMRVKHSFADVL